MLSHTNLHNTVRKIGNAHTILWMRTCFHCYSKRGYLRIHTFTYFKYLVQRFTFFGSGTNHFNQRHTTCQSATIFIGSIQPGTDIIMGNDTLHFDTHPFSQLTSHVCTHNITGMIEYYQQDPRFAFEHLQSLKNALCARSCKNISNHRAVEHTFTYKTTQCRFMTRTSKRDNSNLIFRFSIGTHNNILTSNSYLITVSHHIAFQQLFCEIIRVIYKLIHIF